VGSEFYDEVIESCKELDTNQLEQLLTMLSDCLGVRVPERRVLLNWDEVREMSEHGMTFGSHSCSHRLLTLLSKKEVREEAVRSYEKLRKSGAAIVPVFCYPNGNYDAGVQEAVRDEGYEAALSVIGGVEGRQPSDLFALRRISLHNDISNTRSLFAFALSGYR
jgi:peptidoglycan/xylan/chitin deacetylase (PgdA/CDA1 family)